MSLARIHSEQPGSTAAEYNKCFKLQCRHNTSSTSWALQRPKREPEHVKCVSQVWTHFLLVVVPPPPVHVSEQWAWNAGVKEKRTVMSIAFFYTRVAHDINPVSSRMSILDKSQEFGHITHINSLLCPDSSQNTKPCHIVSLNILKYRNVVMILTHVLGLRKRRQMLSPVLIRLLTAIVWHRIDVEEEREGGAVTRRFIHLSLVNLYYTSYRIGKLRSSPTSGTSTVGAVAGLATGVNNGALASFPSLSVPSPFFDLLFTHPGSGLGHV